MDGTTALAVLGLSPGATASQIKAAYRARAKLVHPDHRGAAESFLGLRQAYETAAAEVAADVDATAAHRPVPVAGARAGVLRLVRPVSAQRSGDPEPVVVPDAAPLPRRRPGLWLADDARPAPVIDVCDIARPAPDRQPAGRPPTRSFAEHLAVALAS